MKYIFNYIPVDAAFFPEDFSGEQLLEMNCIDPVSEYNTTQPHILTSLKKGLLLRYLLSVTTPRLSRQ